MILNHIMLIFFEIIQTLLHLDRTQRNDYIVAGKPNDIYELRSKLFPKTNQRYQPNQTDSMTSRQMNDR